MTILIILLLIFLGIILLLLEFAVIPGFTVFGVGGMALLGYSVYLAFVHYGNLAGIITVIFLITLIPILFLKFLKSKAGKKMQLDSKITALRPLSFYAYGLGKTSGWVLPETHSEILQTHVMVESIDGRCTRSRFVPASQLSR